MNRKNEILLQLIFIGLTSSLIALIFLKLYPDGYFVKQKLAASENNNKVLKQVIAAKIIQSDPPVSIAIPSVDIQLPIAPGIITNNVWTLYDDKATWLSTSQTPGNGNVIIYGHDRPHLFGNLHTISLGDTINVTTNKKTFAYAVVSKEKIYPSNVNSLLSDKNQLTLYTCDGYFDQWRLLIIATFKKAI